MRKPWTLEVSIAKYVALDYPEAMVSAIEVKRWFRRSTYLMACEGCEQQSTHVAAYFANLAAHDHRCPPAVKS